MEDQEFINQLAEKLSKLGTVRPLGFHYLHPYGTVPADSIICNGATYSRALYKDFFDYITTQGWVKTEAEWQSIASANGGYCTYYSQGDGSTTFRTPKFAPFMRVAIASGDVGKYHKAGLPGIEGIAQWPYGGYSTMGKFTGAFYLNANNSFTGTTGGSDYSNGRPGFGFDASRSNAIYGRSDTVQPESHEWIMCVVAYGIATNVGSVDIQNVLAATAQVQAEIGNIRTEIGNITNFAAPDYGAGSTIAANTPTTIQTNGFLRYWILYGGTGGKTRYITINGTKLRVYADNWSTDYGIFPVIKGDSVSHDGVNELVFYPARYGV